ncbi:MAG: calcium-binding protein [Microcoleaceae cyanobacterium]
MSTILIPTPDTPFFSADNTDSDDGGQIISADFTADSDDGYLGTEGSDLIFTLGGDDAVLAGGGDDEVNAGAGNDSISGGEGNDSIALGEGNDLGLGGLGNDVLNGGLGNDLLYGGFGDDLVIGDSGDDILVGGFGDDTLEGGEGADTFVFRNVPGVDTIIGFNAEEDQIVFEGIDKDAVDVVYDAETGSLSIDGEDVAILDPGLALDEDDFTFM